jgi:hypothetical protein
VWPAGVFQGMADRVQVAIVAQEPGQNEAMLLGRIMRRAATLAIEGVRLSTTVLVCAQGELRRRRARISIACTLAALLAPDRESRLVLTSDGFADSSRHELIVLAGAVLEQLRGSPVSVQVWASAEPLTARLAAPIVLREPPPRRQSGMRAAVHGRRRPTEGLAIEVA